MLRLLTSSLEDNGNDETVDTEDTSHNNGDEGLEDEVLSQHSNGGNTDTGLGSTVGSSEVGEDEGSGEAHETEEGVLVRIVSYRQ